MLETVERAYRKYMIKVAADSASDATLRNYKRTIDMFLGFVKKNKLDFSTETMLQFKKSLLDTNKANSTIKQYLLELKVFFDWCVTKKYFKVDMFEDISFPKPDKPHKEFLSVEECNSLLNTKQPSNGLKTDYIRNHAMLCLTLVTGMRVGSLVNLTINDLDFENGLVHLRKAKGNKNFDVPAPQLVMQQVKNYIDTIRPNGLPSDCPVFVRLDVEDVTGHKDTDKKTYRSSNHKKYVKMDETTVSSRICKKYTETICNHGITIHSLRHSAAMYLYSNGVEVHNISELLGHASTQITLVYLHELDTKKVKAVTDNAWNKILN